MSTRLFEERVWVGHKAINIIVALVTAERYLKSGCMTDKFMRKLSLLTNLYMKWDPLKQVWRLTRKKSNASLALITVIHLLELLLISTTLQHHLEPKSSQSRVIQIIQSLSIKICRNTLIFNKSQRITTSERSRTSIVWLTITTRLKSNWETREHRLGIIRI